MLLVNWLDMSKWLACLCVGLLILAGCQSAIVREPEGEVAAPRRPYEPAPGTRQYQVIPEESTARIYLYATGPLASLGHNHVVVTRDMGGEVYLAHSLAESGFFLEIPLAGLDVDPPEVRAEEGEAFSSELSQSDISATRENMLGDRVLNARAHPLISIESVALSGPEWLPEVSYLIRIRGVERHMRMPVAIEQNPDKLVASGYFSLRQSDFGIEPFSVLGGALSVEDQLDIKFRIVALPR